jgi:monoamine oxidase
MGVSLPSSIDVAIIGAGAAGLGAAHALQGSGKTVIVLEARERVGGRACTIQPDPRVTFDLGCGWLHSGDVNSFAAIGEQLGFQIDRTRPPWRESDGDPGFPSAQRRDFLAALDAFYACAEQAAEGSDAPASTCLEPGNPWNPMIDAISTYINGAELDRVSLHDLDAYEDTEVNWRVREGYGALVAAYAAPLPVALNTIVTTIDHTGPRIRIETSRGTLRAGQVIVTVPTTMIAQEAIRFVPALPDKVEAAHGLPLGIADKTTLLVSDDTLPKDGSLRAMTMRTAMGTYHLRPFGQPCIEGFFGGRFARELEEAGEGALLAQSV